jgi:hypothetical protein
MWKGDPGPQGHWIVERVKIHEQECYTMRPKEWQEKFMYCQATEDGNTRGWEEDPGEQGYFVFTQV